MSVNRDELTAQIWRLSNTLKGVMYVRNIPWAVTRLVFLKYVLDNYICATTVEAMHYYADAQKMLALKDVERGSETIWPVMRNLDNAHGLGAILSSSTNMEEYDLALFGGDSASRKKNLSAESYKSVMSTLSEIDLTDNDDHHEFGKALADALIHMIMERSAKDSFRAETTTNHKLNNIVKQVLKVEKGDTFCDFVSGLGISTIDITGEVRPRVMLADINENVASLSAMLLIMYGYEAFYIKCMDALRVPAEDIRGNKLFVDPPVSMRIKEEHDSEFSDSTLIAIDMAINKHLEDGGTAVIPVPGKVLFARDKQTIKFKEWLIKSGFIRAVVALPPMWKGMGINTNLLVMEKCFRDEFVFINAVKNKAKDLSDKEISDIVNVIKSPNNIEGLSYVTTLSEVIAKEYDLLPAKYVAEIIEEEESLSLEEIDAELSILYNQLMAIRN